MKKTDKPDFTREIYGKTRQPKSNKFRLNRQKRHVKIYEEAIRTNETS